MAPSVMNRSIAALSWAAVGLAVSGGCATIAGLDEDYSVGDGTGGYSVGGSGNAAASGGAGATNTGSGVTGGAGATGGFGSGGDSCTDGYECVPDPAGGTFALANADGACPANWEGTNQLVPGDDPGCTACSSCGTPAGSCGAITVDRFRDGACSDHRDGPHTVVAGECIPAAVAANEQAQSYRVSISVNQGSCTPASASSNPNPLAFTDLCELSANPQGSCAGGGRCIPELTGASSGDVCVVLPGHEPCPPGYPQRSELHDHFTDNRTCGCGCGSASGGTCTGTLNLWDEPNCTGGPDTLSVGNCIGATAHTAHDGYSISGISFSPGGCQPVSNPGSVVFSDPVTLCCG